MNSQLISISFLCGKLLKLNFDPEEPCWKFCKRVGEEINELSADKKTMYYCLYQSGKEINIFKNRLIDINERIS